MLFLFIVVVLIISSFAVTKMDCNQFSFFMGFYKITDVKEMKNRMRVPFACLKYTKVL